MAVVFWMLTAVVLAAEVDSSAKWPLAAAAWVIGLAVGPTMAPIGERDGDGKAVAQRVALMTGAGLLLRLLVPSTSAVLVLGVVFLGLMAAIFSNSLKGLMLTRRSAHQ